MNTSLIFKKFAVGFLIFTVVFLAKASTEVSALQWFPVSSGITEKK